MITNNQKIRSELTPVVNEAKQPTIRQRLITFIMILLMSGGFSIEVEVSESYTKVKIMKQQSSLTEVVEFLGTWFD